MAWLLAKWSVSLVYNQSAQFLGYIPSGIGVQPDPIKVKAIEEMLTPTNKLEARSLIGMGGYLSKLGKNIFQICSPIYAVKQKKSEWYWCIEQQRAFDEV